MATSTKKLDRQLTGCWITGFFSQDKYLWYRVEFGDEDLGISSDKLHGSSSSTGFEAGFLNLEVSVPSVENLETRESESVILDNFIYAVGRWYTPDMIEYRHLPVRHIHCLDTTNLEKGWNQSDVQMGMERLCPKVAELDRKIYIFGGSSRYYWQPPSEVYDTVTGKIDVLPKDKYTCKLILVGADHSSKRIIFCKADFESFTDFGLHKSSHLVFYYPETHDWEEEETHGDAADYLGELFICSHVVVGTTIYWMSLAFDIKAYDFVEKRYFVSRDLTFLAKEGNRRWSEDTGVNTFLLHVNGDCFCLFLDAEEYIKARSVHRLSEGCSSSPHLEDFSSDGTLVRCAFLKISISNSDTDGEFLSVGVLRKKTYKIPGHYFKVVDVLPIYRKLDNPPPPCTITANNATPVPEDVSTTTTTTEEKGLKIEWAFVAGAVGILSVYLANWTSS